MDVEILERFCGYIEEVSVRVDHKLSKDFLFLIFQSLHLSYSSFNKSIRISFFLDDIK